MQKKKNNKITLGIFVSLGVALFIICIYFVGKKQQMFNSTFHVSGIFRDISGLQIGNNVRFSGINVGVIDNIEMIADTAVKVDIVINESSRKFIKKDSRAIIGSDGLMGNKTVVIMPGTAGAKIIENNDYMVTALPVSIDEIMLNLKTTSANAALITDDLGMIMTNIRAGKGTIGKLFMDTVFAQNIDRTIVNMKEGAGGFKQNMDAASHNILLRGYLKDKGKEKEAKNKEKEQSK